MLSDIPLVVFKTTPNIKNKCVILANTSRLNNEIIKQRLSCIPVHFKDVESFAFDKYIMEVNVENTTDTIMYVTTEHFTIKDKATGALMPKSDVQQIFPPDKLTGYFIDFVRLRPRASDELPGEKLHLTCEFDIGTAKEDGMFNAVSTCSYAFTIDEAEQERQLQLKIQGWTDDGIKGDDLQFEVANWKLLEGKRVYLQDSYDFVLQSVGIYDNKEIVVIACKLIINMLTELNSLLEKDELEIKVSENTMANSFDIVLQNHDYTIGKILEYFMYSKFYESKELTFCGFKKFHPHDTYSVIRAAYANAVDKSTVKGNFQSCIVDAVGVYEKIKLEFVER
jgi:DNA-directed RNA polymerase subunit L